MYMGTLSYEQFKKGVQIPCTLVYHTYKVGPFTASAYVLEGETIAQATRRVLEQLEQVFAEAHAQKKAAYLARSA